MEIDDHDSNEAVRTLVLTHVNSTIFPQHCPSQMASYVTKVAYPGTASREDLMGASYRMSRMIGPRQPRRPSPLHLQHLRQDTGIQKLRVGQHKAYNQIRDEFNLI